MEKKKKKKVYNNLFQMRTSFDESFENNFDEISIATQKFGHFINI